ncbi:MAG: hypothetical protein AAF378_05630 [Cyanobacteria bacterium P01_A01_bin.84]
MKKNINCNNLLSVLPKGLLLYLFISLIGCNNATMSGIKAIGANITPIEQLNPKQKNQSVYVQGKVEKVVPLLEGKLLYKINDSSDTIWVAANQNGFKVGQQVVIKGKIRYKDIPLAGKNFGDVYLEEES